MKDSSEMEKSSRPIRNRRHSRKKWQTNDGQNQVKRLFTPEIKKMLKEWLVRRRDNPYPSRDEKKTLAIETGLTYTQICNWFANWRRKLKNAGKEPQQKTWGHLIKNYNTTAKGNVEHFSICSNDSIWSDDGIGDPESDTSRSNDYEMDSGNGRSASSKLVIEEKKETLVSNLMYNKLAQPQCFQISSTTDEEALNLVQKEQQTEDNNNKPRYDLKYKSHIMEKYLQRLKQADSIEETEEQPKPELCKWLVSAANFTPSKNNYIEWNSREKQREKNRSSESSIHEKEELDAAEALTFLATNYRNKMYTNR